MQQLPAKHLQSVHVAALKKHLNVAVPLWYMLMEVASNANGVAPFAQTALGAELKKRAQGDWCMRMEIAYLSRGDVIDIWVSTMESQILSLSK